MLCFWGFFIYKTYNAPILRFHTHLHLTTPYHTIFIIIYNVMFIQNSTRREKNVMDGVVLRSSVRWTLSNVECAVDVK